MKIIPVITLFMLMTILSNTERSPSPSKKCVIFNFGDSNTDTGSTTADTGMVLPPPYGVKFTKNETIPRCSDGKVYIDFLCERLNLTYLSPYLESSGSDFGHGVNFAYGGSTAQNDLVHSCAPLPRQISQFVWFKDRTKRLRPQGKGSMLSDEEFDNAIYSIDIGQNDLFYAFLNGTNSSDIVSKVIPEVVKAIEAGVKILHTRGGAKKFVLYNTGPLGCLPASFINPHNHSRATDESGCRLIHNQVAKALNKKLAVSCETLRSDLIDARIICPDMFAVKYDFFATPGKYGFENPLQPCIQGTTVCTDISKWVSLDGIHYTEAANYIIASKIFSGGFWWPDIKLQDLCNL